MTATLIVLAALVYWAAANAVLSDGAWDFRAKIERFRSDKFLWQMFRYLGAPLAAPFVLIFALIAALIEGVGSRPQPPDGRYG